MRFLEVSKVIYFGYICCLSYIITLWPLTILPEIMQVNFNQQKESDRNEGAKNFFTYFYWGMIIGAFIWPTIIKYLSLRNSLIFSLTAQMIFTFMMSTTRNLQHIFILRFLCGLVMNINNVGKAFIFEFAAEDLQQWGFTSKNLFGIITTFGTPLLGYNVFNAVGKSFFKVSFFLTILYGISIFIFWILYYVFAKKKIKPVVIQEEDEEEQKQLIDGEKEKNFKEERHYNMVEMFFYVLSNKPLRSFIIVYMLTNGVFKTMSLISVLFLERSQKEQGLGISSKVISFIAIVSMIPSVLIIFISPFFVPKKISYQLFMGLIIIAATLGIAITPILSDLIGVLNQSIIFIFACINQSTVYWATPKVFSPFMSYIVGKSVAHGGRTAINSLAFILSTSCSAIFTELATDLFSWSLDSSSGQSLKPFNKYISFGALGFVLIIALIFLSKTREK